MVVESQSQALFMFCYEFLWTVTVGLSQPFRFLFSSSAPGTVTIGNLPSFGLYRAPISCPDLALCFCASVDGQGVALFISGNPPSFPRITLNLTASRPHAKVCLSAPRRRRF